MPSAEMVVVPQGSHNQYTLNFARASIRWTLPNDIPPMPVAINWGRLGEDKDLITITEITFFRGRYDLPVPKGYEFDGASVPRAIRWAPGYQRVGRHLWAALAHDWVCDHPEILPRVIGDGIFVTLLLDTGVSARQSRMMYRAVRLYSVYAAWKAGDDGAIITDATKESIKAPETKATAVQEAAEFAKSETSVAPSPEPSQANTDEQIEKLRDTIDNRPE